MGVVYILIWTIRRKISLACAERKAIKCCSWGSCWGDISVRFRVGAGLRKFNEGVLFPVWWGGKERVREKVILGYCIIRGGLG